MDTYQVTREEILLLTRYLLDDLRRCGFKRSADKFARESKIDEEQPLVGSLVEGYEQYTKERSKTDYWTFFCLRKIKTLREQTLQGKALTNTTTNQQVLSVDRPRIEFFSFPDAISGSSRIFLLMLKKYIYNYVARDSYNYNRFANRFHKEEEIDAKEPYVGSSSKKRRFSSGENVKIEK